MKLASLLLLPLLWTGPSTGPAQDAASTPDTPEGRSQLVVELCTAYDQALQAFWEAWDEVEGDEARKLYLEEQRPAVDATAERLLALVDAHPGDAAGFQALSWLSGAQVQCPEPILARVHASLAKHYLDHKGLEQVLQGLGYEVTPSAGDLLQAALERSSRRSTQGQACYAYAKHLLRRASLAR